MFDDDDDDVHKNWRKLVKGWNRSSAYFQVRINEVSLGNFINQNMQAFLLNDEFCIWRVFTTGNI